MTVCRQSIELPAEASEAWSVLIAVRDWPAFLPTIQSVEAGEGQDGGMRVGATFRVCQPRLPPALWTVNAVEAPRGFTWTSQNLGLRTVAHHRLEPLGPGRCRLDLEIQFQGPLRGIVYRMAGGLTQDCLRQEAEAFLVRVSKASPA